MSKIRYIAPAALAALLAPAALTVPAAAKIACEGPYQLSGGSEIRTPYCEDTYLAHVAQGYGMAVAGAEIRHNFNTKRRVCEVIGHDTRVAEICTGMRPEDRSKIWVP